MELKVHDLENFVIPNEKELSFSFRLEEIDLNKDIGKKILSLLKRVKDNKIKFKVTRSLPRCIFDNSMSNSLKELGITLSCIECKEIYTLTENDMVKSCKVINKIGPKIEYLKDNKHIWTYFSTFHKEMEIPKHCKSCLFLKRNNCNALCFRK